MPDPLSASAAMQTTWQHVGDAAERVVNRINPDVDDDVLHHHDDDR